jgi:hypothetical protein
MKVAQVERVLECLGLYSELITWTSEYCHGGGQSVEREGERCAQQSVKYHSACTETDEVALK